MRAGTVDMADMVWTWTGLPSADTSISGDSMYTLQPNGIDSIEGNNNMIDSTNSNNIDSTNSNRGSNNNMDAYCTDAHCTSCNNIRTYRMNATDDIINEGNAWYPYVRTLIDSHAARINVHTSIVAGMFAAFSINTPWDRNVSLVTRFVDCIANNDIDSMYGTLGMSINIARNVYAQASNGTIDYDNIVKDKGNFKIRSFTCNVQDECTHDIECVTVDRWAHRIATNFGDCKRIEGCTFNKRNNQYVNGKHSCGHVPTGTEYHAIAACYRTVAREFNENARTLQAITWVVVRGTGE